MANSGIVWDTGTIKVRTSSLPSNINKLVGVVFDRQAIKVQDHARQSAPWTDRTGNARNGLFARSGHNGFSHEIVLYHTVPYGIWLEIRFAGKNAVIAPTIQKMGPDTMKAVERLIERIAA